MAPRPSVRGRARRLLGEADYGRFWTSRLAGTMAIQIQSVAMGWQAYAIARRTLDVDRSAFAVSLIGLATFAPLFFLALPAGAMADRRDRRAVMIACYAVEAVAAAVLAGASWAGVASLPLLIVVAVAFGAGRAFRAPAVTALGPMLAPADLVPTAIAWNSLGGRVAAVAGSAAAGGLLALSPTAAYLASVTLLVPAIGGLALIRRPCRPPPSTASRLEMTREGLAFVWSNKIIFGAVSLDLAAVILGGATALLPAFARDILKVGATGFGLLRAAPSVGAGAMAAALAVRPIRNRAGAWMFGGVALFGAATVVFGLSRSLLLSLAALAVLGGADMFSVYVRATLEQVVTPNAMRGRVAAFSSLFVGASNELGEFESGIAARFLGPVAAAVLGGVGALAVTALWARLFPALRKADRLA